MTERPALQGVCAAALTPLHPDRSPDLQRAVAYCRRLLETGADAINLLGSTGEATSFGVTERLAVMRAIAHSGLPLDRFMVGTGAAALADAVELTAAAVDLGFAGALVVPPFYFTGITDDGLVAYYAALIERVARPNLHLYLYHYPQLSGVPFSPSIIRRLADRFPATITGVKDSSGIAAFADGVVAACPELAVFPSAETALADARGRGYAGCISATFNINAPLASRVWRGTDVAARTADQTALSAIRTTITRFPLVPAVHHIAARLLRDDQFERVVPPLATLAPDLARELDAELDAQPAFTELLALACA
jgi:4-hydroxy-tetrahydrodipicolinate synthase